MEDKKIISDLIKMQNLIISGGSPSTIIATAMWIKANDIKASNVGSHKDAKFNIIFTQAFQVGEGSSAYEATEDLRPWVDVIWIGLGVNNRDPKMTRKFFERLDCNDVLVYDEHSPEDWAELNVPKFCPAQYIFMYTQNYQPGASLADIIKINSMEYSRDDAIPKCWHEASNWADDRTLKVSKEAKKLAREVDAAIKCRVQDNEFRKTVVLHLLGDPEATKKFEARLQEAQKIVEATDMAVANGQEKGNCLIIDGSDSTVNQTSAMFAAYARGFEFCVIKGTKAGENGEQDVLTIGTSRKDVNLLECLENFNPSGIPFKATTYQVKDLDIILEVLN